MCIRVFASALTCVMVVTAAGCQTYRAAPFDASKFSRVWRARSDASPPAQVGGLAASTQPGLAARTLTLPEAEAYALVFNPSLRLARQRAGVAFARYEHAGKWEDLSLGINVERVLSGSADPWVIGGTVNLTLPVSGRLQAEKARAAAEHHAELIRLAGKEFSIRHEVLARWVEWIRQSQRLTLLDELVERLDAVNVITGKLAESGAINRIEARVFQIERSARQAEQIAARSRLAELRGEILSLLGFVPDANVNFSASAAEGAESGATRPFEPDSNYDVRVAAAEYEAAERALKREIQAQYPDLVIGPGFGTDQGDERALLGLSLPLPLWSRNQPAIAAARAERELARTRLEVAIEQSSAAHATARLQLESAIERRQLHESGIVPTADEQSADAQRLAELGEVNAVLLLDAFVRQYESRAALLDASLAESLAAIRIAELLGETPSTQPTQAVKGAK